MYLQYCLLLNTVTPKMSELVRTLYLNIYYEESTSLKVLFCCTYLDIHNINLWWEFHGSIRMFWLVSKNLWKSPKIRTGQKLRATRKKRQNSCKDNTKWIYLTSLNNIGTNIIKHNCWCKNCSIVKIVGRSGSVVNRTVAKF